MARSVCFFGRGFDAILIVFARTLLPGKVDGGSYLPVPVVYHTLYHPRYFLRFILQETNISPKNGTFEDDFPFPKVGYVNLLDGIFKGLVH